MLFSVRRPGEDQQRRRSHRNHYQDYSATRPKRNSCLKIFMEYTDVTSQAEDRLITQTNRARYVRTVNPGAVTRLGVGKRDWEQQWVELVVKEVEAEK